MNKILKVVQQNSAKGGISAKDIAPKIPLHRSNVHKYLTSLELMEKVYSDQGLWKAKPEEQATKPSEMEIVIKLQTPEKKFMELAILEIFANLLEDRNRPKTEKMLRTLIEKYKETRIIKIKGKNVNDLDLEKIKNLIEQANKKSSKINLKGKLKKIV